MYKIIVLIVLFLTVIAVGEWDASNYPNPTTNGYQQCNMRSPSSICDPDAVLNDGDRYKLNYQLNELESRTRQTQGDNFCAKKGIVAAIAIARRVRGGSENAVKVMANDMLRKWILDNQCGKSLVIVVSVDDRKFWVARDARVPVYAAEFTDLFNSQKQLFRESNYQQALSNVIEGTANKALAKQFTVNDGSSRGTPFQPNNPRNSDGGKSGLGVNPLAVLAKIPLWVWLALFLVVIPTLCCCCCLYLCCCRSKRGTNEDPEHNENRHNGGGGGGSGGRMQGLLSGMSGGVIANLVSNCLRSSGNRGAPSNTGGGQNYGNDGMNYPARDGGYTPGQQRGKGLYPSVEVKDEGGGGNW